MKTVQLLKNKGYSLSPEEEVLISRLKAMENDLEKPSIFRGRLNEIWASVMQIVDTNSRHQTFEVTNSDSLKSVFTALSDMQSGLGHLTQVLQQDEQMVQILGKGYQEDQVNK
jgi:nuclear pore complex protein Nup54